VKGSKFKGNCFVFTSPKTLLIFMSYLSPTYPRYLLVWICC